MRCRLLALAALAGGALPALAQDPGPSPDSAAVASCVAVDSAVIDSVVRDTIAAIRGTRAVRPRLIEISPSVAPSYGSLDEVQWQTVDVGGGLRLAVAAVRAGPAARASQLLLRLPPGTAFPAHWHAVAETFVVMRGAVLVRDSAGRVVRLSTGGYSAQPARAAHSLATEPDAEALLLVTSEGSWDIHLADEARVGAARPPASAVPTFALGMPRRVGRPLP